MSRRELLCHRCMKKFKTHSRKRVVCYTCKPASEPAKQATPIKIPVGRFTITLGGLL